MAKYFTVFCKLLFLVCIISLAFTACDQKPAKVVANTTVIDTIPAPTLLFDIAIDSLEVVQSKIKRNEFLRILKNR